MNSEERPTTFREHSFLQWLREEFGSDDDGILGIGDDTAWCPSHGENGTLWAMDTVCEGVHMEPGHDLPARLGRKAVLVNLSDIASMGGVPNGALLSIALPKGLGSTDAKDCARAVVATCREYGVRLLGGDTVSTAGPLVVTVALSGHSEGSIVRRAGASDGDLVVVTGALGGSLHDGRHGEFRPRLLEASHLMELAMPSAMTDISDGLSRDLANILDASQCGAVINRHAIPIHPAAVEYAKQTGCEPIWHALNDGEDFELLFTIAPAEWHVLRAQWKLATALSVIGKIEGSGLVVDDGDSRRPLLPGGFEHGED